MRYLELACQAVGIVAIIAVWCGLVYLMGATAELHHELARKAAVEGKP